MSPKPSMTGPAPSAAWDPVFWFGWIWKPQPIVRLELLRILLPVAILTFMSGRIAHADDWLSDAGFQVPYMPGDWRQPFDLHVLPVWAAWSVVIALVVSGIMTSLGAFTRISTGVFAAILLYVALADRFSAFTVSKLSPVLVFALSMSPAGTRWSIDAWRRRRREPAWRPPTLVSGGCVRFFQILLPVFYFSSGIWKARGDWWANYDPLVLWAQLHDSYQTPISWWLANHSPGFAWTVLQWITLVFEIGAPLWYALPWTRPVALGWAVSMHLMIGLMFGPVLGFGLLMITLNVASYAPAAWLERALTPSAWRRAAPAPTT
jgi:uncharacterized membrane protein YphA (DoxX/SURF4 family)